MRHKQKEVSPVAAPTESKPEPLPIHDLEHFFKGVCICSCKMCCMRTDAGALIKCTCKDCPTDKCGMRVQLK